MKTKSFKTYCEENDLHYLLREWNDEKNNPLTVDNISKTSRLKVFWKCSKCGFVWETQLASRAIGLTGCPECYRKWLKTTKNEKK